MQYSVLALAIVAPLVNAASKPAFSTIEPTLASIVASEATAKPLSPVSNVPGKGFDRIVQIWLENVVSLVILWSK